MSIAHITVKIGSENKKGIYAWKKVAGIWRKGKLFRYKADNFEPKELFINSRFTNDISPWEKNPGSYGGYVQWDDNSGRGALKLRSGLSFQGQYYPSEAYYYHTGLIIGKKYKLYVGSALGLSTTSSIKIGTTKNGSQYGNKQLKSMLSFIFTTTSSDFWVSVSSGNDSTYPQYLSSISLKEDNTPEWVNTMLSV